MKFVLPDGSCNQTIEITDEGEIRIQSWEDVSDVLAANERERNHGESHIVMGSGTQTSMTKLGEVSALKAYQLMKEGIFFDDNKLRGWFKDLDNYLWGVTRGKKGKYHAVQST